MVTLKATYAVATAIAPWAKLTIRAARQISTSDSAKAANTAPFASPSKVRKMNRSKPCRLPEPRGCVRSRGRRGAGPRRRASSAASAVDHDPTERHHDAGVGDGQGAAHVLLDQQHGQAGVVAQVAAAAP